MFHYRAQASTKIASAMVALEQSCNLKKAESLVQFKPEHSKENGKARHSWNAAFSFQYFFIGLVCIIKAHEFLPWRNKDYLSSDSWFVFIGN